MRKSIDGLVGVVQQVLEHDPFCGHLFVFCNRCRDRIKILYWDQSGFWLLHKRLEKGTFAWPAPHDCEQARIELTSSELAALLGGIDVRTARRRRWYARSG